MTLTIVAMTNEEEFIEFLDPEFCTIEETLRSADLPERTDAVAVPESYDKGKPAPLFVWIGATDGGRDAGSAARVACDVRNAPCGGK